MGKSRLAGEVAERARRRGAVVLLGASYEQEGQLPYGPFAEALEAFARGVPAADLRALVGDVGPEVSRLSATIAAALGGGPAAELPDRQRLFAALAAVLGRLAAHAPMVLVLDDLHAADAGSLQLLHYLARAGRSAPLFLLGSFRPEQAAPAVLPSLNPLQLQQRAAAIHAQLGAARAEARAREALGRLAA